MPWGFGSNQTTIESKESSGVGISTDSGSTTATLPTDSETKFYGEKGRRYSALSGLGGPGVLDMVGSEEPEEEPPPNPLRNDSSSVIRFYPEWCRCAECMKQTHPYAPDASCLDRWRNALLCPPHGPCAKIFAFVLIFFLIWIFLLFLLVEAGHDCPAFSELERKHFKYRYSPAGPSGPIFVLGLLEILGLFSGILMKSIHLPSLLGPLVLGIFLRNIDYINIFKNLEGFNCTMPISEVNRNLNASHWIKPIRQIALAMILTRAGLELSPKQLRKLKGVVPMLSFGPCIVEACTCAITTWIFFSHLEPNEKLKMNIYMCFVSGFALAAVSPAVVVPGMLSLKRKNLGVGQGVPTLLIAAASIDDVLAISAYTIFLGLALADESNENAWVEYTSGPFSIVLGVIHGLIVGSFLHFIPSRDYKNKAETRLMLLLLFNFVAIFGYEQYEVLSGAGSLAVLVTSFIASFGWRSQPHWKQPMKKIGHSLSHLWTLCVPLLFGTIGREIDFQAKGFGGVRLVKIFAIIFISVFVRCCTAFLVVGMAKLNCKERLFCAMSWVPKATVQAALAPLVLSKIIERNMPDLERHGRVVVTTAVLGILITAPLGSILIAFFGRRLLQPLTVDENELLEQEEFPGGDGVDPVITPEALAPVRSRSQLQLYRRGTAEGGSFSSVEVNRSHTRIGRAGDAKSSDGGQLRESLGRTDPTTTAISKDSIHKNPDG